MRCLIDHVVVTVPTDEAHIKADLHWFGGETSTLELLFFDLVFVAGIAQLASGFAGAYDPAGGLRFVGAFLVRWWAWLGHTFHASRFDEDRADQRRLGLAQIPAVVLIGYGAGEPFAASRGSSPSPPR